MGWVFYNYVTNGYCFGISPTVSVGRLFNESNFFEVDYPASKLGTKCNLNDDNIGYTASHEWVLYGHFQYNNYIYYFDDGRTSAPFDLSGSDNWVKVTKNSGKNFTLEFSITISGKLLKGYHKENFQERANYYDIGYW